MLTARVVKRIFLTSPDSASTVPDMNTREAEKKIGRALAEVKVIDPHVHLDATRPAAATIADIVLYHHVWIELVSAGMGQTEVTRAGLPQEMIDPQMEPRERVRLALRWLPRIRTPPWACSFAGSWPTCTG